MLIRHLAMLMMVSCMFCGCQAVTSSVSSVVHNPFESQEPKSRSGSVTEMVCLWEEAEGIGLDEKPTRGFAGQIMFFSPSVNEPVPVHGDVEVFLFDDLGSEEEQAKPLHTFKFEKEAFEAFKTETNLGIAYQLFLPYVRKSNYKANCSLRVRVSPAGGRPLYSKIASLNLHGPESPQSIARAKQEKANIQLAAAQEMEKQQPLAPTSPEQTAAYFGATSLPVPVHGNSHIKVDKQRLRSALKSVVQSEAESPSQLSLEAQSNASRIPAPQNHPLLD